MQVNKILEKAIRILFPFLPKRFKHYFLEFLCKRKGNVFFIKKTINISALPKGINFKNIIWGDKTTINKNTTIENSRLLILEDEATIPANSKLISSYKQPLPLIIPNKKTKKSLEQLNYPIIIVLGTGRSGTESIIKTLNQSDDNLGYHEPFDELIALSTYLLHKKISRDQAKNILYHVFKNFDHQNKKVIISDQKFANLIPILNELFVNVKFLWIIRCPRDFIKSSYSRGWFSDKEFGFSENPNTPKPYSSSIYSNFRIDGAKCNEFTEKDWIKMHPFEKNCWYWYFWNKTIENNVKVLPQNQYRVFGLYTLSKNVNELSNFIGTPEFEYIITKSNVANYEKIDNNWPDSWLLYQKKWCDDYYQQLQLKYNL